MTVNEQKLSAALKSGELSRVYFFYGDEPFLTNTYTDRVIAKTVGSDADDINLVRLCGEFSADYFDDSVQSMPMFAACKTVLLRDPELDRLTDADFDRVLDTLAHVPEECTVIISLIDTAPSSGKKSRHTALISALSKQSDSTVCKFSVMQPSRIAELIMKKAAKSGCVISRQNALYLTELTLCDLTLCSAETEKLCCYKQSGEITAEMIDALVIKCLDTKVFALSTAINKGERVKAFSITDDLLSQKYEPIMILATLAGTYIDAYRALTAISAGKTPDDMTEDFGYAKNRSFAVSGAFNNARRLKKQCVTDSLFCIFDADIRLKTTSCDGRIVLQQTVARLFELTRQAFSR